MMQTRLTQCWPAWPSTYRALWLAVTPAPSLDWSPLHTWHRHGNWASAVLHPLMCCLPRLCHQRRHSTFKSTRMTHHTQVRCAALPVQLCSSQQAAAIHQAVSFWCQPMWLCNTTALHEPFKGLPLGHLQGKARTTYKANPCKDSPTVCTPLSPFSSRKRPLKRCVGAAVEVGSYLASMASTMAIQSTSTLGSAQAYHLTSRLFLVTSGSCDVGPGNMGAWR